MVIFNSLSLSLYIYIYQLWLLEFEPTKSQELIVTNSPENHKVTHPPLSMGGVIVEEKEQLEALGFTIDPRGNWSLHAEAVAKKARKKLGWCHQEDRPHAR